MDDLSAPFTFDELEAEVRRLVAESPDFVYPSRVGETCWYAAPNNVGKPPCLFGQAINGLRGPDHKPLPEGTGILAVLGLLDVEVTKRQGAWADDLQARQDRGVPWAQALIEADHYLQEGAV